MSAPISFTTFAEASDYISAQHAKMNRDNCIARFDCNTAQLVQFGPNMMMTTVEVFDNFWVIVVYEWVEGETADGLFTEGKTTACVQCRNYDATGREIKSYRHGLFTDRALGMEWVGDQTPSQYFASEVVTDCAWDDVQGDTGHDYIVDDFKQAVADAREAQWEEAREAREFDAYGDRDLCR